MRHPYYAISVSDFWAKRWNVAVQEALRQGVFDPCVKFLPRSMFTLLFATFMTFLVSGLLHEIGLARIFPNVGLCNEFECGWDMTWFFVATCGLVVTEKVAFYAINRATGFEFERFLASYIGMSRGQ
jgi:Membrane bound O-acyl transferase family